MKGTSQTRELRNSIFKIGNEEDFNRLAMQLFRYQSESVPVYRDFLELLGFHGKRITHYSEIPFLPVTLFKTHEVIAEGIVAGDFFSSSGTTGQVTSKHYVNDLSLYENSFTNGFEYFYGDPAQYCFLALLPSYLERSNSSLVYMMDHLIKKGGHKESGFYLRNYSELKEKINQLTAAGTKIFLMGITYALLDLAEMGPFNLGDSIVMETGGMKGIRKEMIREELHRQLCEVFHTKTIHSEYGMTELLSQAYSTGNGKFKTPPWMRILMRDIHDPFINVNDGTTGVVNVIDLANIDSCAFIATEDLGRSLNSGEFELLGRMDFSEMRGCNLMI